MAFQWTALGDPLAFVHAQSRWQDRPALGWGEKALALLTCEPVWSAYVPSSAGYCGRYAAELPGWVNLQLANPLYFAGAVLLVALGAAKRWLTMHEVLLAAGLVLIPYVARGYDMCMASQGRFMAAAFPMYLVLGHLLCRLPLAVSAGVLALSAVYLAIYSALFTAGHLMI
jgi:hypothetical protein